MQRIIPDLEEEPSLIPQKWYYTRENCNDYRIIVRNQGQANQSQEIVPKATFDLYEKTFIKPEHHTTFEEQGKLGKDSEVYKTPTEYGLFKGPEYYTTPEQGSERRRYLAEYHHQVSRKLQALLAQPLLEEASHQYHSDIDEDLAMMNTIPKYQEQEKLAFKESLKTRQVLDEVLETLADHVNTSASLSDSKPISQEQPQVNQKTLNKSISGSDTDSNYTYITDSSSSIGASSNTSAPSLLPPQNLERVENDIARALSGMTEVSTIIKEAFKGLSQTKFNRRLAGSLREFSKNIKKSPSTKQLLSQQQLSVLRGIGSRVTLKNIALKIKESLECPDASVVDDTALRSRLVNKLESFTQGEIIDDYFQSSEGTAFQNEFDEFDGPMHIGRSPDHDDSDESWESSDDDEEDISDVTGYDEPVQGILDYLKSDEILEIFKNAVIKRFLPTRRKDKHGIKGRNVHQEGGATGILGNTESEHKQQTPEYINEGDDFDDQVSPGASIHQLGKEIGVQSENIHSFTMSLMDEEVQKLVIENSLIESGDVIEGKATASTETAIRIQNPAPKSSSLRCLSPQLTEESEFSQDLVASPVPMGNDEHLWATRFSDGKTHISFEIARRWNLSNEIKGWVEEFIREPINWWPLSHRRHSVPHGYVYVRWKCRCGRRISSIIRKERMHQYHMYQWLRTHSGASSSSNNRSSPASKAPAPAQPIANPVNPNAVTNEALGNPTSSSIAVCPGATCSLTTRQGVGIRSRNKLLMWCINLGSKVTVVRELDITPSDNDEAIFRGLRTEYLKVRSWRRWFSLYTISYIKFVKFRLYRLDHMRVSCYKKEEIPTPNHPYYEYRPESVDVPPVPPEELMHYFENPSCIGTTSMTIDVLPKKVNGKMSLQEKYGWGLRACEALSFFRILILFLIIQAGPIAFFIYWLRKHPGDLQNASVPLFLAFALMGTFIVFPTITEVRFYDI